MKYPLKYNHGIDVGSIDIRSSDLLKLIKLKHHLKDIYDFSYDSDNASIVPTGTRKIYKAVKDDNYYEIK